MSSLRAPLHWPSATSTPIPTLPNSWRTLDDQVRDVAEVNNAADVADYLLGRRTNYTLNLLDITFLISTSPIVWYTLRKTIELSENDHWRGYISLLVPMIRRDMNGFLSAISNWGVRGIHPAQLARFRFDPSIVSYSLEELHYYCRFSDFRALLEAQQRNAFDTLPDVLTLDDDEYRQRLAPSGLDLRSLTKDEYEEDLLRTNLGSIEMLDDQYPFATEGHEYVHVLRIAYPGDPLPVAYQILSPYLQRLYTIKVAHDMEGVDLFRVKELLGHADISTTMRYAHLAPKAFKNDLERVFGDDADDRVGEPRFRYAA